MKPNLIREWAMPSGNTFTIPPIKAVVELECSKIPTGGVIVDPFARTSRYGTITNDLDPNQPTMYHMDALAFLSGLDSESADLVLFDPPYSLSQAAQLYSSFGKDKLEHGVTNSGYWADVKDEIARITKHGGKVIECGWNTNGIGASRGFELETVLIVAHGGRHNDTLVTVERKYVTTKTLFDFKEKQ